MANKSKIGFLALCLTAFMATMAGCAFKVEYPKPMQTASQDFQITENRIEILVEFNQEVDMSSLRPGTNIILETDNDENTDITLTIGTNPRSLVLTTNQPIQELLNFNPDGEMTLIMRGSGPNPIRSAAGVILDGDNDGRAGGDYRTSFVVLG